MNTESPLAAFLAGVLLFGFLFAVCFLAWLLPRGSHEDVP